VRTIHPARIASGLLAAGLVLTVGCNDPSDLTEASTAESPSFAVVPVARVALTPSDTLRVGPVGAKATMVGRAWDSNGKEVIGATLKFWTSSSAPFSFTQAMCPSPCTDTLVTKALGTNKVILSQYGGTARDTAWIVVSSTPSAPGDTTSAPPSDTTTPPPPTDTTTTPPPPPPPPPPSGSAQRGCPDGGYTRLVSVSTKSQLSSALSNAKPGDQIRLAAGTYLGKSDLTKSGTSAAPITVCATSGTQAILRGGRFKNTGSWVVITGLVFEGPNGGDGNVYLAGGSDVQFTGNEVRNSDWHYGVSAEQTCRLRITNNYIHDNGGTSGEIDHGIYFRRQLCPSLIANTLLTRSVGRGISLHDISSSNKIENVTVVHNTIVSNGSTGILMATNGGTGNVVANNVIANNGLTYKYKQIRVKSGTNGNTVANNDVWSPTASQSGIELWSGTTNTVVRNVMTDPMFMAKYSNLQLQAGSPAVGLGDAKWAVSTDYTGKTRDGSPDAGAYER
jgi:hypothetical protein